MNRGHHDILVANVLVELVASRRPASYLEKMAVHDILGGDLRYPLTIFDTILLRERPVFGLPSVEAQLDIDEWGNLDYFMGVKRPKHLHWAYEKFIPPVGTESVPVMPHVHVSKAVEIKDKSYREGGVLNFVDADLKKYIKEEAQKLRILETPLP